MIKRILLILIPFILGAAAPQGCAHGLNIKIYYSKPEMNGLIRKQDHELIPYEKTDGYRCLSPSDFEAVLNYVKTCKDK